jgi:hypothetical protein
MYNVPPKFNQICRLCLTLVDTNESDEIMRKLSIFNHVGQQKQSQPQHKSPKSSIDKKSNESVRDDEQINSKNKRSNEISISLSGGRSVSVFNNGFKEDESDGDIAERIAECLSIKVSQIFFLFYIHISLFMPFFIYPQQHHRRRDCQLYK